MVLPMLLFACESKMDEHYEVPDWLKGSAWEVLEGRGNYTIFLEGAEIAGFKPILEGKSILTVMAPNDEAFKAYFQKVGKSSITDFSKTELVKLIGFHLMKYAYGKDRLVNFRPSGDGDEDVTAAAGLYYKFETYSQDSISPLEIEDQANPGTMKTIMIYHYPRLLPVFSYEMFKTKGIDASYNYEYFFPETSWSGTTGFNVSNAAVTEYETITDNGYVHFIDKVLTPLETVYTEMQNREDKYSHFVELYERFRDKEPQPNSDLTTNYGNGSDLYLISYGNLPQIAQEWFTPSALAVVTNSYLTCNGFAPTDAALETFFDVYWKQGGYQSLADVDLIALQYLLYAHIYEGSIVFPEQITRGDLVNTYDDQPLNFDVDKVSDRVMCNNGTFYGLDEIKAPVIFRSVTGPAFQYADLSCMLSMLSTSGMIRAFASTDAKFTALMPSNLQFEQDAETPVWWNNILEDWVTWSNEGEEVAVSNSYKSSCVNMHFSTSAPDLLANGKQVVKTNSSYNYWYVKDGKITSSAAFNAKRTNPSADPFVALSKVSYQGGDWLNGNVYRYSGDVLKEASSAESLVRYLAQGADENLPYYEFSNLLRLSGIAADQSLSIIRSGDKFTVFIPSNEALRAARSAGKIRGVDAAGNVIDQEALSEWLSYYFVSMKTNSLGDFPYVGSGMDRICTSLVMDINGLYTQKLTIKDDGKRISVTNNANETVYVVDTYDQFPFVYEDGGFHIIDGVLEYKN